MGRSRDAIDALVVRAEACAADNRTVAQRLTSEALAIGDIDLAVRAEAIERVRGLRMDVVVGQGQCVDALGTSPPRNPGDDELRLRQDRCPSGPRCVEQK